MCVEVAQRVLGLQGNPLLGKLRWVLIEKLILKYFLKIQIKSHDIYRVPWSLRIAFLGFGVPTRPISHSEEEELTQLNAKKDLNRREKPPEVRFGGGLENGRLYSLWRELNHYHAGPTHKI